MVDLVYSDLLTSGEDDPNALHLDGDEAECVASYFVDEFGVEYLENLGYDIGTGGVPSAPLLDIPVPPEKRVTTIEATRNCVDFPGHLRAFLAGDARLTATEVDCLTSRFLEKGLMEQSLFSAETGMSGEELRAFLPPIYESCGITREAIQRRDP